MMNLCRPFLATIMILLGFCNQRATAEDTKSAAQKSDQQKKLNEKSAAVAVDGPRDLALFNVEPKACNYDVQSFINGDSDELIGFDARPERRINSSTK